MVPFINYYKGTLSTKWLEVTKISAIVYDFSFSLPYYYQSAIHFDTPVIILAKKSMHGLVVFFPCMSSEL